MYPDLLAYPLDAALSVLAQREISYTIVYTAPPKGSQSMAPWRIVRQRLAASHILELTVAQEQPL